MAVRESKDRGEREMTLTSPYQSPRAPLRAHSYWVAVLADSSRAAFRDSRLVRSPSGCASKQVDATESTRPLQRAQTGPYVWTRPHNNGLSPTACAVTVGAAACAGLAPAAGYAARSAELVAGVAGCKDEAFAKVPA